MAFDFIADPTVHGGDVDLQALMRLAIAHDTRLTLSPPAADMPSGRPSELRAALASLS